MQAQTEPLQTLPEPQAEFTTMVVIEVSVWWLPALAAVAVFAALAALWWRRRRRRG